MIIRMLKNKISVKELRYILSQTILFVNTLKQLIKTTKIRYF